MRIANMTPTERDKLCRAIVNYRIKCDYYLSDRDGGVISQEEYEAAISGELDSVVQLITADRKRVALGARIDAAEHVLNTMVHEAGGYCDEIDPDDITNYIAELKQELSKLLKALEEV